MSNIVIFQEEHCNDYENMRLSYRGKSGNKRNTKAAMFQEDSCFNDYENVVNMKR